MQQIRMSYLTPPDCWKLQRAKRVGDVTGVALRVIGRIPEPFLLVIGSIASWKDPEENLVRLHSIILQYKEHGKITFNHLPFLRCAEKIVRRRWKLGKGRLSEKQNAFLQWRLWKKFYRPILVAGNIRKILITPNSAGSSVVKKMKRLAWERGIPVRIVISAPK